MIRQEKWLAVTALAVAATLASHGAARAEYPDRPITMIIPWAAGGSTDQTSRVLAKAAEAALGQPIVIVNRPGASTTIGMSELANAKPDGYTIGSLSSSSYLIAAQGRKLPYDPIEAFSYISYYGDNVIGIAALADAPWKSLKDLVEDGKARPGKIKFGTGGVGTSQHMMAEALQLSSKAKFIHIPQQGSAGSMPALLGKHVDFISEVSVWAPFVENKEVQLYTVSTPQRAKQYPNVPTLAELGYRSSRSVQAIIGPAGIPEPIRAKLETAFRKALADDAFKQTMNRLSMEIVDLPGPQVKALVESEYKLAQELIASIEKDKK